VFYFGLHLDLGFILSSSDKDDSFSHQEEYVRKDDAELFPSLMLSEDQLAFIKLLLESCDKDE